MTEDNAVDTFLMYCMEQITNILILGGDTECHEELVLITYNAQCVNPLTRSFHNCCFYNKPKNANYLGFYYM